MALLRLEKVKWSDFFCCKKGISYKWCAPFAEWRQTLLQHLWKGLKFSTIYQTRIVMLLNQLMGSGLKCYQLLGTCLDHKCCSNVCLHSANGAYHLRNSAKVAALLPIKTPFLEGFCPFFVLFLAFSRTICIWNAFFAKKIAPFDLL